MKCIKPCLALHGTRRRIFSRSPLPHSTSVSDPDPDPNHIINHTFTTMPHPLSSKKLTRSHTTLIDGAIRVVKRAVEMSEVSKVSLGIIKKISIGKPRIKFLPITGGIKAIVRGNAYVQEIFIYTSDDKKTVAILTKFFEGK